MEGVEQWADPVSRHLERPVQPPWRQQLGEDCDEQTPRRVTMKDDVGQGVTVM